MSSNARHGFCKALKQQIHSFPFKITHENIRSIEKEMPALKKKMLGL
jgi:hypothetical protein